MVDVVLFEFEGVIAETRERRTAALRRSLADDGIEASVEEIAQVWRALPSRAAAAALLERRGDRADEVMLDLIALRADRYFGEEASGGLSLVPGARDCVGRLEGRARLGIVTRASRRDVERTLALAELGFAFECVVTSDEMIEQKPSPIGYERALERLSRRGAVQRDNVIALEDGPAGIRAARAAGIRCVAVGPMAAEVAMDADGYIKTLEHVTLERLRELGGATR
jgi:HAD superfamily hydrolase (TIGR01509 family)